jgi:hypothetical protein
VAHVERDVLFDKDDLENVHMHPSAAGALKAEEQVAEAEQGVCQSDMIDANVEVSGNIGPAGHESCQDESKTDTD